MKVCSKCMISKALKHYYKDKRRASFYSWCKKCHMNLTKSLSAKRRKSPKGKLYRRNHYLRTRYGLSTRKFLDLIKKANYCCEICRKHLYKTQQINIDHSHKTGKVRGILCSPCNVGLGMFQDNKKFLLKAITYLQRRSQCPNKKES